MRGRGCGRTAGPAASRTTCRHLRPMRGDASKDAVAPSSRQLPVGNRLVTRGRGRGRGTEMCGDAPGGLSLMDTTGLRCARDISHWFITGLRWCRSARSRGRGGGCCPSRVGCPGELPSPSRAKTTGSNRVVVSRYRAAPPHAFPAPREGDDITAAVQRYDVRVRNGLRTGRPVGADAPSRPKLQISFGSSQRSQPPTTV